MPPNAVRIFMENGVRGSEDEANGRRWNETGRLPKSHFTIGARPTDNGDYRWNQPRRVGPGLLSARR